jgi:membrane-bound lytic murein transglycosylase D
MAYSRAKASGLWQFIPSTGKSYNLQQNWWLDARRDIVASTTAALDYLQFLYDMHGDWHLALASYNWGENAVARAIEKNKARRLPTDYLNLTMPAETRYYVPKLQAIKNIVANPAAFSIDLDHIPNEPYFVTVEKTQDMDIRTAAKLAEMPVEELIALNPAYNRPVITAAQSQTLVLPADHAEVFRTNLGNHDKPLSSWQTYTLKAGDKLERVAALHGMALARLKQVNGIGPRSKIGPGQLILVPVKGSSAANEPLPGVFQPPPVPEARARKVVHTVKKGDTLPAIAQRYRVSTEDLRRWNQIGRLTAGQKIVIQQQTAPRARAAIRSSKATKAAKPKSRAAVATRPVQKTAPR